MGTDLDNSSSVLKRLLACPSQSSDRHATLFDEINILHSETPHSDFLAWLLDPLGPLTDNWLLRLIFSKLVPSGSWPGTPTVDREVSCEDGRMDICISWENEFNIVIENKIWSAEGDQQIARYLRDDRMRDLDRSRLIFLTPTGRVPTTWLAPDGRGFALGYRELAEMLNEGLTKEPAERGRVFAQEYRDAIYHLLKVKIEMRKPELSEASTI